MSRVTLGFTLYLLVVTAVIVAWNPPAWLDDVREETTP